MLCKDVSNKHVEAATEITFEEVIDSNLTSYETIQIVL